MKRIERGGKLYAIYDTLASIEKGVKWYSSDIDGIQVASMSYGKGKVVKPHTHIFRPRSSNYTQESVIVVKGKIEFSFYDLDKVFLDKVILGPGDLIVSFMGYHGMEVIEDDTVYFEIKTGPFTGNEGDKEFMNKA